jgi:Ca2+-binding RTX toxin-like protein
MKFNPEPESLKSLGKSILERKSNIIGILQFDLNTGQSYCNLGNYYTSELNNKMFTYSLSLALNLYTDSPIQWEMAIGSENLGFIQNLRQKALDEGYNNSEVSYFIRYGWLEGWVFEKNNIDEKNSSFLQSILNNSQKNELPMFEESVQYGDYKSYHNAYTSINFNDYLVGWKNTDELYGLLGNDTLDGQAGNDVLYGGYGKDILLGGDGNDVLYGEQSNDSLLGGAGNDYIEGGLGLDTMNGGEGNDTYLIDNPKDVVIDGNGSDTILIPVYMNFALPNNIEGVRLTGNENISATGNSLNNTLTGNEGENSLNGAIGNDTINAGSGDDTLTGGSGKDIMSGGVGADVFSYQSVTESDIINANAFDMIKDFNLTEGDKINLSAIDAKSGGNANDSFSFYSAAPKTAGASSNGAVWFSNGFLYASNDTDIQAEFKVALTGASNITASSIIL